MSGWLLILARDDDIPFQRLRPIAQPAAITLLSSHDCQLRLSSFAPEPGEFCSSR
jgi:hypothetical protein